MSFSLEKLFRNVFLPQNGDKVTILYDLPHGEIQDTQEWRERNQMAEEWRQEMSQFSKKYGVKSTLLSNIWRPVGITAIYQCTA